MPIPHCPKPSTKRLSRSIKGPSIFDFVAEPRPCRHISPWRHTGTTCVWGHAQSAASRISFRLPSTHNGIGTLVNPVCTRRMETNRAVRNGNIMRSRANKKNRQAYLLWGLRAGVKPLIALALFAGTLLFCALPSSVATNPPAWQPLPAQPVDPAIQDMELTLRARRALADDPVIAKLDLGVEVRNRVATLWG